MTTGTGLVLAAIWLMPSAGAISRYVSSMGLWLLIFVASVATYCLV